MNRHYPIVGPDRCPHSHSNDKRQCWGRHDLKASKQCRIIYGSHISGAVPSGRILPGPYGPDRSCISRRIVVASGDIGRVN